MKKSGHLILLLGIILISNSGYSKTKTPDYDPNKVYSSDQLKSDLNYLFSNLIKAHPGLNWYTNASDFKQYIHSLNEKINTQLTELEFLQLIASINNQIKCVHSDIRPSDQLNTWLSKQNNLIPINVMKVGQQFYVSQNMSGLDELEYGTEIISINEQPISQIIANLLPYIPADGDNETRKYIALSSAFSKYYAIYSTPFKTEYTITYLNSKKNREKKTINGITKKDFLDRRQLLSIDQDLLPIEFKTLDTLDAAILNVRSFRHDLITKANINYYTFLDQCFERMKEDQTKHLIIDLRNNGGGYSEYGAILAAFLVDSTYQYCKEMQVTSDQLFSNVEYDIAETFSGFPKGIIHQNGIYIWPHHSILKWRQKETNSFNGKVHFLINGGCASTTSEFASVARHHQLGQFYREEVGGAYPGDSGGVLGWIKLPNTSIKVRIAMVKYILNLGNDLSRHGVLPDFPIQPDIAALKAQKDPILEFVLQQIHED